MISTLVRTGAIFAIAVVVACDRADTVQPTREPAAVAEPSSVDQSDGTARPDAEGAETLPPTASTLPLLFVIATASLGGALVARRIRIGRG